MQICAVAPEHVGLVWPLVRGFLAAAMRRGYDRFYDEADIREACRSGAAQLWVACGEEALEAAVVTRIMAYPKCRVCQVPLVAGRHMRGWLHPMLEAIEAFARAEGCALLEGAGRGGWSRAAGFSNIGPILMKELTS